MPRQADQRPLVIRRYRDIDLAHGMTVVGGVYGQILVIARYQNQVRRREFPLDSPLVDRLAWQHQTIETLRLKAAGKHVETTLAEDIDTYLASLSGKRGEDAAQWLDYWKTWYGYLQRSELTLQQCQVFFQEVRPKTNPDGAFSASSKNKLRTYLINVWRYHDGRRHECPCLDVPLFAEPAPEAKELPPDVILSLLGQMQDTPSRAKLAMLFVTGCRPAELAWLRPESFDLDGDVPHVRIRGAKGGRSRMVPLPPMGVAYARDFLRHQAWQAPGDLYDDMQRAAKQLGLTLYTGEHHPGGRRKAVITPYALRHTYAMQLRRSGAGIDDIADQLGHATLQTTRRYAQSIPERQVVVTNRMWERMGAK